MEGRRAVRVAVWGLVGLGVVVLLALVAWLIWKVPPALYAYVPEPKDRANAEALTRTGIIAGLAGLAGLAALGSLAMTTWMTTRTYRLTQQGQLTDRYTKAIEQLGSDKLDVRLGGIYALERIAVDSTRDHPTIVEVLSAFIRDRTALRVRPSRPGRAKKLGVDVRGALTVLGRLPSLSMSEVVCTADLRFAGVVQTSVDIHLPVLVCANVRFVLYSCARRRVPWMQDELPSSTKNQVSSLESSRRLAVAREDSVNLRVSQDASRDDPTLAPPGSEHVQGTTVSRADDFGH